MKNKLKAVTTNTHDSDPKILVITRTFFPNEGGIEEYVYNRCLQDPDAVIVLTSHCPGDKDFDETQAFIVHRWWSPTWLPENALGSLAKQLINMVGSFCMALWLYPRYRYHAIEWCHGYDFPSLWLLTYLLPIQSFMYLHGNDLLCPLRSPLIKILFAITLRRLNGIVCNSSFTEQYLRSHYSLNVQTYVINPTVRLSKFGLSEKFNSDEQCQKIRQLYGIDSSAVVLLSVGRLVKRKGFDRVIKALPQLRANGLDVHYIICGRGPMQPELEMLAQQLGVSNQVHFAGFVSDQALASYYASCDIFVLLTFFDIHAASIEGFGIVYVEAGYFGKPCVGTRIGGVVDAVHHGESGWLVDPTNEPEIVEALQQLCNDSSLRERMGQGGRAISQRQTPHRRIYSAKLMRTSA